MTRGPMIADADLSIERQHGSARIEPPLRQREVGVGEDHAEQQQRIGILDQSGDCGISSGAR